MKTLKILSILAILTAPFFTFAQVKQDKAETSAKPTAAQKSINWLLDIKEAEAKATKESKPLIIFFTGSDWCGWCMKLVAESLSKSELIDYANKNYVMLLCDFPRDGADNAQIAKNSELAKAFNIKGFPTLVLLDMKNKKAFQFGYSECNTPKKFIKYVDDVLKSAAQK